MTLRVAGFEGLPLVLVFGLIAGRGYLEKEENVYVHAILLAGNEQRLITEQDCRLRRNLISARSNAKLAEKNAIKQRWAA